MKINVNCSNNSFMSNNYFVFNSNGNQKKPDKGKFPKVLFVGLVVFIFFLRVIGMTAIEVVDLNDCTLRVEFNQIEDYYKSDVR